MSPLSTVNVNGSPATVEGDNSFEGRAAVTAGENMVTVEATDVNGNTTTNHYSVTVTGSGSKTLVYDPNGKLTTRTFEWDPLNRLTAVTSGTHRSEFTYNGLSQRVKIVEKENGTVTSTKQFVWITGDPQPSEERDASNNVTKRYYSQGMQVGSTNYYYTKDHLGSIRELTDSSSVVQVRYDYDPYGRRTKVTGTVDADFGFTGHYYHQLSGLQLALYRVYDPDFGRWISRDPIGELGGMNLYGYVLDNPINLWDRLGLAVGDWWDLPANFSRSREIARDELRRHHGHNDAYDAMRHAEWQCRTAAETNQFTAWISGLGHELDNLIHGGDWNESIMDLHNNAVGRQAAEEQRPILPGDLITSPGPRSPSTPGPYDPGQNSPHY